MLIPQADENTISSHGNVIDNSQEYIAPSGPAPDEGSAASAPDKGEAAPAQGESAQAPCAIETTGGSEECPVSPARNGVEKAKVHNIGATKCCCTSKFLAVRRDAAQIHIESKLGCAE